MSDQIVPQDFYVYAHRRASDGRVFYVGKGRGNRAWSIASRNKHWHRVVKKHGLKVQILQDGLQEWYALELECELISFHGRENLCNMTNGGEGTSGHLHSEETLLAMSTALKGKPLSEKNRLAISAAKKGKPLSEKNRLAIIAACAKPILCVETGQTFQTLVCAEKWLKSTGKPKATRTAIHGCCNNKAKSAYGYTWRYA